MYNFVRDYAFVSSLLVLCDTFLVDTRIFHSGTRALLMLGFSFCLGTKNNGKIIVACVRLLDVKLKSLRYVRSSCARFMIYIHTYVLLVHLIASALLPYDTTIKSTPDEPRTGDRESAEQGG